MTNWPLIHLCEARMYFHRRKYEYDVKQLHTWQADATTSRRMHHPKALKRAEAEIAKWGPIVGQEAREIHKYAAKIAQLRPKSPVPAGEGVCVPKTAWNPYRREIANWIARELYDAFEHHGASGVVTSGRRTYQKQKELYELYERGGNVAAPPGSSNHEGYDYTSSGKKGAVDFEPAENLARALHRKPHTKLLWAEEHGLADHPHFSGTGH